MMRVCASKKKPNSERGEKNSSYDDDDDDNGRKMIHIYEREETSGKKMKNSIENSYFEFVI